MLRVLLGCVFLLSCGSPEMSQTSSLTDGDYTGKKYYLGWGLAANGDPQMMHNEVKYDVLHTHDIFTKDVGGDYIGTKLIGNEASRSSIQNSWTDLNSKMLWNDMYLQYSSGHGHSSGLAVGVSYNEMRDAALSLPAKEIIIFTMACKSGGLVESFDARKSEWENWSQYGRTLFVMASSNKSTNSSTGPGRDPDEPGGPSGSAGSAFGHALWKAIIGYGDENKDGYLNLGELIDYTVKRTREVGGHTPVMTGVYNRDLVMAKVPPRELVEELEREGGTGGMTDEEIIQLLTTKDYLP